MKYYYDNKQLSIIDIEGVKRPSEDPVWLVNYFKENINIHKNDIILDMGCGMGVISLMLAHRFSTAHIHGMDIQKNLIQSAKKNASNNSLHNCTFEHIDILNSNMIEKYGHVISNPPYHRLENGFDAKSPTKKIAHGTTLNEMNIWINKGLSLITTGGTFTFIQHMHNLKDIEVTLKNYNYKIQDIQTSPTKSPKKFIAHIQK